MPLLPTLRRRVPGHLSPWRDLDLLEDEIRSAMGGFGLREAEPFLWAPRVDFAEENGKYMLTAELPGVEPGDVDVEVEGNRLSIKGEKKLDREQEDDRVRIQERRDGSFERMLTLPSSADPDKVTADFRKGVLKVEIEKRPEAQGRKIQLESK